MFILKYWALAFNLYNFLEIFFIKNNYLIIYILIIIIEIKKKLVIKKLKIIIYNINSKFFVSLKINKIR